MWVKHSGYTYNMDTVKSFYVMDSKIVFDDAADSSTGLNLFFESPEKARQAKDAIESGLVMDRKMLNLE